MDYHHFPRAPPPGAIGRDRLFTTELLLATEWASQRCSVVKNAPASAGDLRDTGSILGSGRSPEGGHDNPLWYSCLENLVDRGAWGAAVDEVAQSDTTGVTEHSD